jgi:NTE family protein
MKTIFSEVVNSHIEYRRRCRVVLFGLVALAVGLTGCASRAPEVRPPPPVTQTSPPSVTPSDPVITPRPPERAPRIGLALGGGAARGFAHIGVLQVLEEQGIKPDLVVGTSAGSVVATLYAAGRTPVEMGRMAMTLDESTITDWVFPGRSVLKGEALARFVRNQVGNRPIEAMRLPLGVVAADLQTGQPVLFRRGDAGAAVRASSAVPAVFEPVRIGEREYIDGGAVSPVPVRFARQMGAEVVIAVDISAVPEGQPTRRATDILLQTFSIMGKALGQFETRDAEVVIRPKLEGIGSADFSARRLSILAGREATLMVLPQIKAAVRPR